MNTISISPLHDRYNKYTENLKVYFSEFSFFLKRMEIEIVYLAKFLGEIIKIDEEELGEINELLLNIFTNFDINEYSKIKEIELITNHDVKAIEYYLKGELINNGYEKYVSYIHFGLTSQDINNTAISVILKQYLDKYYLVDLYKLNYDIFKISNKWKDIIMISRTHGQPAVPTKLGKEIMVFKYRLDLQLELLKNQKIYGKFGGAVGNFNAHKCAYPNIDWEKFAEDIYNNYGIKRSKYTTQIDSYDSLAVVFDNIKRINNILLDLCQDIWLYISMDYLKQKININETGSSTMPHKVNPINFENAEGNLKLANTLLNFFSDKLPISRLQRDLTDSTVLRNLGISFGYIKVAYENIVKGLNKLDVNKEKIEEDLDKNYFVIVEGIQTVLRKYGYKNSYEKLKELSRTNKQIGKKEIDIFIQNLDVNEDIKEELMKINVRNYI